MDSLLSLLRSLWGPTQVNQSFFAGASNIIISGGQFNNVAGDYVVRREHSDPAQVQRILLGLLETDLVRRSIAHIVGYSHENGGVTIIDALGEKLVFPPTIMALFSDVHDNLSKHFRWKLGEDRVHSRRYCLVKQGDGLRVDENDWNTVVQAGEVLVMCMLIEKVWVESRKQTCPKCGDTRLGTQRDGGFYVCRRCHKRFTFERAPIEKRFRPPSEDDNTVATFVNNDDMVTLLSRKYVAAQLESSESTTDHFAFLLSSGMYVTSRFESSESTTDHFAFLLSREYVTDRFESSESTTDHFAFLLPRKRYIPARLESSESITDHFAFLLSSGYVTSRFESSESTTDHFAFLLSSGMYVTSRFESSESTTDHFAFLLSRERYIPARLESSESITDHFAFLLSSGKYVPARHESSESTTDHFAFLLSREYVTARFESSESTTDHFAFLLSRERYIPALLESSESTTDHFAFLLSSGKYVPARLESSESTTDHFTFLLSSGYVAARLESSESTTDHCTFLLSRTKSLSSAYRAVFIHLYQWVCLVTLSSPHHKSVYTFSISSIAFQHTAERHEASRFEEVVEEEESDLEEEESDLEDKESDLGEEESNVKEEESDQEMC
ncbi:hypothetical protein D9613_007352 [Agrocybe pediades]|uniref:Ubiquitin-like domain-containing protein n=1 Tax=Agrocybe pediades TaxID=84607 RepID=A0A8H4VIF8_9AGAR|nr:hypothetical protein D9613_007352 [Agrocybe pediades]